MNAQGMAGWAGTAQCHPWWQAGVCHDSRLPYSNEHHTDCFLVERVRTKALGIQYKIFMICLFITAKCGWRTCGKSPLIFGRSRCPGAFAAWTSVSVSCVCARGAGGKLGAHIPRCGSFAGSARCTFQNASTALMLLSSFIIDPRREMESFHEQQAHLSLKVFLTNRAGVDLLFTLLCLSSAQIRDLLAMFFSPAAFPGTQLCHTQKMLFPSRCSVHRI